MSSIRRMLRKLKREWECLRWRLGSRNTPPPHLFKQKVVKKTAKRRRSKVLIETGTYLGDMVQASRRRFERIYSIEIDRQLCDQARLRFGDCPHVRILHGDSADLLGPLLHEVRSDVLFWLDGHYSGEITGRGRTVTPILDELRAIAAAGLHNVVILIDDARLFVGDGDYPAMEDVRRLVNGVLPGASFQVADDIIRVHGPSHA